jgi:hypothetical protein
MLGDVAALAADVVRLVLPGSAATVGTAPGRGDWSWVYRYVPLISHRAGVGQ